MVEHKWGLAFQAPPYLLFHRVGQKVHIMPIPFNQIAHIMDLHQHQAHPCKIHVIVGGDDWGEGGILPLKKLAELPVL